MALRFLGNFIVPIILLLLIMLRLLLILIIVADIIFEISGIYNIYHQFGRLHGSTRSSDLRIFYS